MSDDNFEVQLFEDLGSETEPVIEPKKRTSPKKKAQPIVEEFLQENIISNQEPEEIVFSKKKTQKKSAPKKATAGKTPKKQNFVMKYSKVGLSKMDKIIKIIAFLLATVTFLVFALAAAVLVMLDDIFMVAAAAVLLLGVAISLITLFLLFGFGQIITQNNQILKRFNEMSDSE